MEEEDFVITLQEDGWTLGSVQSYNQQHDHISVQALFTLKTEAKDDKGKTYWIYPNEEVTLTLKESMFLKSDPQLYWLKM